MTILQHFEFTILHAVDDVNKNAYAAEVGRSVSNVLDRDVALAQVYVALKRLKKKEFVTSQEREFPDLPGRNRREVFSLTAKGKAALKETVAAYKAMK